MFVARNSQGLFTGHPAEEDQRKVLSCQGSDEDSVCKSFFQKRVESEGGVRFDQELRIQASGACGRSVVCVSELRMREQS